MLMLDVRAVVGWARCMFCVVEGQCGDSVDGRLVDSDGVGL